VSLLTFEVVILPFQGDAVVIELDQAVVRDGDAMGITHWSVDAAAAPEPAAEPVAPVDSPVERIPEILQQLFLKESELSCATSPTP
jgi:hypothetical protein